MEETAEQRSERLRALREQALFAVNYGTEQPEANTSDLPPFSISDSSSPQSSASRFEYYTDPLVSYTGCHKKKKTKLYNYSSPHSCSYVGPVGSPVTSSPTSNSEDTFSPSSGRDFFLGETVSWNRPSPQASKLNCCPEIVHRGGYGHKPNPNPNYNHNQNQRIYGHNSVSNSNHDHDRNHNFRKFNRGIQFRNHNTNPIAARYQSHNTCFRSSHQYNSKSSSQSPHFIMDGGNFRPQGNPVGMNRGGQPPSGTCFHNSQHNKNDRVVSAIINPHLFAKRSMIMDPWKDLVHVRIDQSSD